MKIIVYGYSLLFLGMIATIHADGCGYIIRNETKQGGSSGGTVEFRFQQGATDPSQVIQVAVGEEKELVMHDAPLCQNPRLILAGGLDGDIKGFGTSYEPANMLGTFHKMILSVKSAGFGLADKTKRQIVIEVKVIGKSGEAA